MCLPICQSRQIDNEQHARRDLERFWGAGGYFIRRLVQIIADFVGAAREPPDPTNRPPSLPRCRILRHSPPFFVTLREVAGSPPLWGDMGG